MKMKQLPISLQCEKFPYMVLLILTDKLWYISNIPKVQEKNLQLSSVGNNLLNIQMDHMPINLHMSGSFEGNTILKDRTPPSSMEA